MWAFRFTKRTRESLLRVPDRRFRVDGDVCNTTHTVDVAICLGGAPSILDEVGFASGWAWHMAAERERHCGRQSTQPRRFPSESNRVVIFVSGQVWFRNEVLASSRGEQEMVEVTVSVGEYIPCPSKDMPPHKQGDGRGSGGVLTMLFVP